MLPHETFIVIDRWVFSSQTIFKNQQNWNALRQTEDFIDSKKLSSFKSQWIEKQFKTSTGSVVLRMQPQASPQAKAMQLISSRFR